MEGQTEDEAWLLKTMDLASQLDPHIAQCKFLIRKIPS